jgi:uncharacterized protein YdaU (DUF1376 family)
MHYYSFHIGDYRSSTAHLSNAEDLAYRRLIDMYYDTEQPIPLDTQRVARRLRVGIEVVSAVLDDFFTLADDGWHHERCNEEIEKYHVLADRNRKNGKLGGRPKKPSGLPVVTQSEPTGKATNNHKPITNNQTNTNALARPESVSEQVWSDYLAHRKRLKANLTETALTAISKQAVLAGWSLEETLSECILRGWRGFKADWVKGDNHGHQRNGEKPRSPADRFRQRLAEQEGDGKALAGNAGDIRPQVGEQFRVGANGELGEIIEGDFTAANSKGS